MRIFALSDTHFSLDPNRTMAQFGPVWRDHETQIKHNWKQVVGYGDLVLIGGDISWQKKWDEALVHLRQLDGLPGKYKVMIKGNHDHWWKQPAQMQAQLSKGFFALQGSAVELEGQVIAGTRGWLAPNDPASDSLDQKTFEKEMLLLKQALDQALTLNPREGIHLLLHFPPFTTLGQPTPFWDLLKTYPVATCSYGHFHLAEEWEVIPKGRVEGIDCYLTAADFIRMTPQLIWSEPTS